MSYSEVIEDQLRQFLDSNPDSIKITTEDFLSDEPIPQETIEEISKELLDTQYVKDKDGNYYWPSIQMDVFIIFNNENHFFFSVQDKQAADVNLAYSKAIDQNVLNTAMKDNDEEVQKIIKEEMKEYDKDPTSNHLNIIVQDKFMTKEVIMNAGKEIIQYWSKKFPKLSELSLDFIYKL